MLLGLTSEECLALTAGRLIPISIDDCAIHVEMRLRNQGGDEKAEMHMALRFNTRCAEKFSTF